MKVLSKCNHYIYKVQKFFFRKIFRTVTVFYEFAELALYWSPTVS